EVVGSKPGFWLRSRASGQPTETRSPAPNAEAGLQGPRDAEREFNARSTPVMSSALLGILQLDRGEPLGYGNFWGLIQAWLQDAGGFAAVGLVVYLLYVLATPTDKSESEKLRVPVSTRMVLMAGLSLVCYALVLAILLIGKPGFHLGKTPVTLMPPPVIPPPPGSPVKVDPPVFQTDALSLLLM